MCGTGKGSEANPTLLFELPRALLKLRAPGPAFDPLFQLPNAIGHSMLRRCRITPPLKPARPAHVAVQILC